MFGLEKGQLPGEMGGKEPRQRASASERLPCYRKLSSHLHHPLPEMRLAGEGDREAALGARRPNSRDCGSCEPLPAHSVPVSVRVSGFHPFNHSRVGRTEEFYNRS